MNRFDFTPYRRSTVGFDRLFDLLENASRSGAGVLPSVAPAPNRFSLPVSAQLPAFR